MYQRYLQNVRDEEELFWSTCNPPPKIKEELFVGPIQLVVPTTRYSEVEETITIKKKQVTGQEILQAIYDYYQQPVTLEILEEFLNLGADDGWGYIKDAIKTIKDGNVAKRIDLMGDATWFEGIVLVRGSTYTVSIGS